MKAKITLYAEFKDDTSLKRMERRIKEILDWYGDPEILSTWSIEINDTNS